MILKFKNDFQVWIFKIVLSFNSSAKYSLIRFHYLLNSSMKWAISFNDSNLSTDELAFFLVLNRNVKLENMLRHRNPSKQLWFSLERKNNKSVKYYLVEFTFEENKNMIYCDVTQKYCPPICQHFPEISIVNNQMSVLRPP